MPVSQQTFLRLAHASFDYLVTDFQFVAEERVGAVYSHAGVTYDSSRVRIGAYWNTHDGIGGGIAAKAETFWIRPASPHGFDFTELLQLVAPEVLCDVPHVSWPEETEAELQAWLAFHAAQLRAHGESLLRGELTLCEDMLIMRYCNSAKGLPLDEYFKVFRDECATLSLADREQLETAMASRSPRQVYFLLSEWVDAGKLRGKRLYTALGDLRAQYFQ